MPKVFKYGLTVTIGDTNLEGNVYWTNFCSWFGKARELFLMSLLPPEVNAFEFLQAYKIMIITCNVSMEFIKPAFFTNQIVVKINTDNFKKCSVDIVGEIINEKSGEVLATARQKVAFANIESKEFMPIPDQLLKAASEYQVDKQPV